MPMFAVIASRVLLGTRHSARLYLTLLPIVGGVVVATLASPREPGAGDGTLWWFGLGAAVAATLVQVVQNLYSKLLLTEMHFDHLNLQLHVCVLCWLVLAPIWVVTERAAFFAFLAHEETDASGALRQLAFASVTYYAQSLLAFSLVARATVVSYSVGGTVKRVVVIVASIVFFNTAVTAANSVGIFATLAGVFLYNHVRQSGPEPEKPDEPPAFVAMLRGVGSGRPGAFEDAAAEMPRAYSSLDLDGGYGELVVTHNDSWVRHV